jgi:hypothetical protein
MWFLHNVAHNCVDKVSQGRSKVADDAWPGRPVEIATEATVQCVEELIQTGRRITIDSLTTALGCSHDLAYSIMHDLMKFQKVCTQQVPKELKDWEKVNWMGLSLKHLLQYADEGEDVPNRIVTGDKSWVHRYQSDSKRTSLQWKHPNLP